MTNIGSQPGTVRAYGLIRDKNGRPVIDDINNIPGPIWAMLTKAEQEEIANVRNASR